MHFDVQPRHLHYNDVVLSHVRVNLGLGLERVGPGFGLECVDLGG